MHWVIAAPFITDPPQDGWLTPWVPPDKHTFTQIPAPARTGEWHKRKSKTTDTSEWKHIWRHGKLTLDAAREKQAGIITHFPQLAAVVGLRQRVSLTRKAPTLAWSFNLGQIYTGLKGRLARAAMKRIDRFVVHSRREITNYSTWLNLPPERFEFVPIQRADIAIEHEEDTDEPFVLAMGSAARDYRTFIEAMKKLNLRTVIVAAPHAIEGIELPSNVQLLSKLSAAECHALAQKARINVVPIANDQTASGQVTVIEAMTLARAVIATRCIGTEDYITNNETGLLVAARDANALAEAVDRLWNDASTRAQLGSAARKYARSNFSDEAVAQHLTRILDVLTLS
jgi:glycosyltransferase involved in cell wall biosynthesis